MKVLGFNEYALLTEAAQKFKMNIPKEVMELFYIFKKNKYKLFIVGGAVRDALLGKKPKDYDVATDATPDEIEKIIDGKYKIIDGGKSKDLGVTIIIMNGEQFEIATFREDLTAGRRPDAVKFSTIDKDVLRRDLTINALFYDIDTGEIVDLVGGVEDIEKKRVRAVGDAEERFNEDALRKLRAIRFAGVTGSRLDRDIDKALKKDNSLPQVSPERIRDEFKKTVEKAKDSVYVLKLEEHYGFFPLIFPDYYIDKNYVSSNRWILQLAQMLKDNDDGLIKKLTKLTYAADEARDIIFLKEFLSLQPETVLSVYSKWQIAKKGDNKIDETDLKTFAKWNSMDSRLVDALIEFTPTISGDNIMKEYGLRGKAVGDKKNELEAEKFLEIYNKK